MGKGLCQQFNGGVAIILSAMFILEISSARDQVS